MIQHIHIINHSFFLNFKKDLCKKKNKKKKGKGNGKGKKKQCLITIVFQLLWRYVDRKYGKRKGKDDN